MFDDYMELKCLKKISSLSFVKNVTAVHLLEERMHRPHLARHLFLQIKFYWNTATPTYLHLIYGSFSPQTAGPRALTETTWPAKVKMLYFLVLSRTSAKPCLRAFYLCKTTGKVLSIGPVALCPFPLGWPPSHTSRGLAVSHRLSGTTAMRAHSILSQGP